MTAVIKSSDLAREGLVRALAFEPVAPAPSDAELRFAALRDRCAEAEARCAGLEAALAEHHAGAERAIAEAFAAGETRGAGLADDRSKALLDRLQAALDRAGDAFALQLETLETGAGDLAGIALERIVGASVPRARLVEETVRRAAVEIFGKDAVRIEVSRADFPEDAALADLRLSGRCEVQADDTLPSGACRIRLKLGGLDLGLDGQVARVRAALARSSGDQA